MKAKVLFLCTHSSSLTPAHTHRLPISEASEADARSWTSSERGSFDSDGGENEPPSRAGSSNLTGAAEPAAAAGAGGGRRKGSRDAERQPPVAEGRAEGLGSGQTSPSESRWGRREGREACILKGREAEGREDRHLKGRKAGGREGSQAS